MRSVKAVLREPNQERQTKGFLSHAQPEAQGKISQALDLEANRFNEPLIQEIPHFFMNTGILLPPVVARRSSCQPNSEIQSSGVQGAEFTKSYIGFRKRKKNLSQK